MTYVFQILISVAYFGRCARVHPRLLNLARDVWDVWEHVAQPRNCWMFARLTLSPGSSVSGKSESCLS